MRSYVGSRTRLVAGLVVASACWIASAEMAVAQTPPAQPDRTESSVRADEEADDVVVAGEYVVMLRPQPVGAVARGSVSDDVLSERIDAVLSRLDGRLGLPSKAPSRSRSRSVDDGGSVVAELSVVDGFAARLNAAEAAVLAADPEVLIVEPNTKVTRQTPSAIAPTAGPGELPWGLDRIDQAARPLDGSYSPPNNGSGVTVYVIDDGVWTSHQEFIGRVNPIVDFVGDVASVDEIAPGCMFHGTHVAGTIAGANVGVASAARIQPVRVLGCVEGNLIDTLRGVDWVYRTAAAPAVVNMSLGGARSRSMDSATQNLTAKGITVAVAAGNKSLDACEFSPAGEPSAITVAASTVDDRSAGFSNDGPCVDLYAPGVDILSASTEGPDRYESMNGTSMASPHVAGTAAVYLSAHPTASPAAVQRAIVSGAVDGVLTGVKPTTPNKLVQVNGLPSPIEVTDDAPVAHITPPDGVGDRAQVGSRVTFDGGDSFDPLGGALTYEWRVKGRAGVIGTASTVTTPLESVGPFEVILTVANSSGDTSTAYFELFVADLRPPVVKIDPPAPEVRAKAGATLSWDASASFDPDGGPLTFRWYLYNQEELTTELESNGPRFSITYPGGNYAAVVVVTNQYGTEEFSAINLSEMAEPVALVYPAEAEVRVGDSVTFDGGASYDNFTQDGGSLKYEWTASDRDGVASTDAQWERVFDKVGTFKITLKVTSSTGESDTSTATVIVRSSEPSAMTSIDPVRVLDTRLTHPEVAGPKGIVDAGKMVRFSVGNVPTSATGVVLNVTAVAPGSDGHLTVYPCGPRPVTSNLNYHQGTTRGNLVVAALGDDDEVCIWTFASTDIVVDLTGYVPADSAVHSISPVRAFDTRRAEFGGTGPIADGGTIEVQVTALSEVPDDAAAVFVNLAAAGPRGDGHLTAYPCGDVPPTSSLNYRAGETLSSAVIVALSDKGTVCVRSHAATDVVVDVLGYVDAGDSMQLTLDRAFDTRAKYPDVAPPSKGPVPAGETVKVNLGVDAATTAGVFVTVTAVAPGADGHLTVFPCGEVPVASGLNYQSGVTTSNMVFAKVDDTGSLCVRTHATTDLVVDYAGSVTAGASAGN